MKNNSTSFDLSWRSAYLSNLLSHQQGTTINVIPFALAKPFFVSSLPVIAERGW